MGPDRQPQWRSICFNVTAAAGSCLLRPMKIQTCSMGRQGRAVGSVRGLLSGVLRLLLATQQQSRPGLAGGTLPAAHTQHPPRTLNSESKNTGTMATKILSDSLCRQVGRQAKGHRQAGSRQGAGAKGAAAAGIHWHRCRCQSRQPSDSNPTCTPVPHYTPPPRMALRPVQLHPCPTPPGRRTSASSP